MKRSLIIQTTQTGLDIALIEDDRLVEFHQEITNKEYIVGDIYLGRVKKILPGLNAAFIDIGHDKNAFLHYHDLGPNFRTFSHFTSDVYSGREKKPQVSQFSKLPDIPKNGDIAKVLQPEQPVVVQLMKEPISTKGHRLSSYITIAGKYLVLIPFANMLSISKRIHEKGEKKRLNNIFSELRPNNLGLIVRTAAENKSQHLLEKDLEYVLGRWNELYANLSAQKPKLLSEINKATGILRDLLNDSFDSIIVDDKETYDELFQYLNESVPDQKKILRLYKDIHPLFEAFNIDRQIKSLFGKIVNFGKGSYLVIEHTEAMTVIDINSGSKTSREFDREEAMLNVNLEAADEIARQLRLRDIGGLIVVDFIDMKSHENQKLLVERMRSSMKKDRAQHSILPISKFGLMEITRQRVKPAIELSISETCPSCRGSGEIKPTILVVDDIEHSLNYIASETKVRKIILKVHPFINAYLNTGLIPRKLKWMIKYKIIIRTMESLSSNLVDYKIMDSDGNDLEEF